MQHYTTYSTAPMSPSSAEGAVNWWRQKVLFLFVVLLNISYSISAQVITTFAGGGTSLPNGVPALSAQLHNPQGGVFDSHGNYYFVEYESVSRIDKIDTAGIITTIAGTGTNGYNGDGGMADTSMLNWPSRVIVDTFCNLYICDVQNQRIRKIDAITGVVSTFAGNGIGGYSGDNGPATAAELYFPGNISFDRAGNLLIADGDSHILRKVNTMGIITTIAGNGSLGHSGDGGLATLAQISPSGLSVDDSNNLYVSDATGGNSRITKISALTNVINTIAGTDTGYVYNGDGISALLANIDPEQIFFNNTTSNLYISDGANNRIRRIDNTGIIYTVAGNGIAGFSGDSGSATAAEMYNPNGIGFDACGNLYFADVQNKRIRKVTFDTTCGSEGTLTINQINEHSSIFIYPNPANDVLHIDGISVNSGQEQSYRIMSIIGITMQQGALQQGTNSISVSSLPSGIYIIEVSSAELTMTGSGQRKITKIVKQ